jgi:DNA modification methylase
MAHSSATENDHVSEEVSASPATVTVEREFFVTRLLDINTTPDLATLRQKLAEFKKEIAAITNEAVVEPVSFSEQYLVNELEQIAAAQTIDRAHYYLERLLRAAQNVRTGSINDINLNRWKEYDDINTDSLWLIERRERSGVHNAHYWGNFVPQIPNQMMRRYTRKGDWVLDPFAGSGTTLIEGQRLGRNTLGIELQPRMVEHTHALLAAEANPHNVVSRVVQGDCLSVDYDRLLADYGQRKVQLIVLHPPYFDIIKFSDNPHDLSNSSSVEAFLTSFGALIDRLAPYLERGRHIALVIGDKYAHGEWIPLGFRTMEEVLQRGFNLKSIVVKNFETTTAKRAQKELWRYRALVGGFYVFKHEYLFLFRK